jgi:Zn-dependent membrane protease YugP
LSASGYLQEEQLVGAGKVLRAAAMTYVAALAQALAQLLRLLMIANRGNRRD